MAEWHMIISAASSRATRPSGSESLVYSGPLGETGSRKVPRIVDVDGMTSSLELDGPKAKERIPRTKVAHVDTKQV